MFIVYGFARYGRVDDVPGIGYVDTMFFHIMFVPIYPACSDFFFDRGDGNWRSAIVPVSLKSVFVAWLRAACLVVAAWYSVRVLNTFIDRPVDPALFRHWIVLIVSNLTTWSATLFIPFITRASYQRALVLMSLAELGDEGVGRVNEAYGVEGETH